MLESLGVEEVKQFRKRWSTVLRYLLLTIGNQIKIVLLDETRKLPFFGTDEVTDVSNIQNLVTFILQLWKRKSEHCIYWFYWPP